MIKTHITSSITSWPTIRSVKSKHYPLTLLLFLLLHGLSLAQVDLQNIPLPGTFRMDEYYSMTIYEEELYFVASDGSNGINGALFKYDGTSFTQITLPAGLELVDENPMVVFDGALYMVMEDGSNGIYGSLYQYDGSDFTQIDLTIESEEEDEAIAPIKGIVSSYATTSTIALQVKAETDMVVYNDKLYLVLRDGPYDLYSYDGTEIIGISLPEGYNVAYPSDMTVYNENLYLVLEDGSNGIRGALYEFNGSTLSHIVMPETYAIDTDGSPLVVYEDELYFAIGDGFVGIRGLLYKYDGENVIQALSTYEVQEEYGMEVYAGQMYMVLEDDESNDGFYKFNGTSVTKLAIPSNYEIQYDFDLEVFNNRLFGVFSDYDNSIYSGLFALNENLDESPPLEAGMCGRNILEFEQGAYAHVGTITDFSYSSGTFEAWIKKNDWTETYDDALFSNGIGYPFQNSFYISFHPGVGLHFRYGGQSEPGNTAAYVSTTSTDTLTDGSWHHIAATWYNNGSNTQLITYIDGIEIANVATTENLLLTGTPEFGIGEGIVNYLNDFDGGAMSEIRLWDVAKSQEEIEADMNQLMTGLESGLIAYWPFNDPQGSTSAANLVQPEEVAALMDFTDVPNAWVNYPLEISADGNTILKNGTYNIGSVGVDESLEITFNITNHGFQQIELVGSPIASIAGSDSDQFIIDLSGTSASIAAGGSTTFTVSFEPTSLGEKTASFSMTTLDGCSDPYQVNISGIGLNDDCDSAQELTVFSRGEGAFTAGSTESVGIFEGSVSCAINGTVNDLWYSFTTGSTGAVEINTSLGTAASLSGAVYISCDGEDIYCVTDVTQKVYLPLAPNVDVYLQLWNSEENEGTFSIRINEAPNTWAFDNWSASEAPTSTDDALILGIYSTSAYGSLEVQNLELLNDNVLYAGLLGIENGDHVIVNGDLLNNGGINVESGGSLTTYGTITNAEFEDYDFGFKGMQIERNSTFDNVTGRYSIVGSPIEDADFSNLGSNAVVYTYDESELYNAAGNMGADRFKTPAQLELLGMNPGEGYFSVFTGDENGKITFTGTPNFGNINVDLSYTDHSTTSGDPTENDAEGFNLVSNPYPSAISVSSFLDANDAVDIDQTIYIWDDFGSDTERGTNADYIVINELGSTLTNSRNDANARFDGHIRSAQGFFVKANSASQTLQFTDDMKVNGNNSDAGYFRTGDIPTYKLIVSNEESNKALIIGFTEDASLGKDKAYDALTLSGGDLQFYSKLVNGTSKLAIQGVPTSYSGEIPLVFSSSNEGMYTIHLEEDDKKYESIWLTDNQTGTTVDLTTKSYSFLSRGEYVSGRFTLSRASQILGLENTKTGIYAINKTLYIQPKESILTNYQLYNLQGARMLNVAINGSSNVDLSHLPDGVYLVSNGLETVKIILK